MTGQVCAGVCGRTLVARTATPASTGEVRHHARGRCHTCYNRDKRHRAFGPEVTPRTGRVAREEVLDHWVAARSRGWTCSQAARDFGLAQDAYAKHLRRARAAGDTRGNLRLSRRERVLRHWEARRDEGWILNDAAADFGEISRQAYSSNLARARRDGDERGEVYRTAQADRDESLLEDWDLIRDQHPWIRVAENQYLTSSVAAGAQRMGLSVHSLKALLKRARNRGDDRGTIILDSRRSA